MIRGPKPDSVLLLVRGMGGVGDREKKKKFSARCGARTHDPGIKSPMLYRLS